MTLLPGDPKAGKSTTAAAAVAGVVSGVDWLSGEVQAPRSVLWIAAPGESGRAEVAALLESGGAPPDALERVYFLPVRPSAVITAALAGKHRPAGLGAVVVDTARGLLTADGGAEDSADDVRRTMVHLSGWATEHGAAVLVLSHTRRDRDKPGSRQRGSGDWMASVDLIATLDRDAAGDVTLTYEGRTGCPVAPLRVRRGSSGRFALAPRRAATPGSAGGGAAETGAEGVPPDPFAPWRPLEAAVRAALTAAPAATDRAIAEAAGLPTGGRKQRAAYRFIAEVKSAMLADSGDGASAFARAHRDRKQTEARPNVEKSSTPIGRNVLPLGGSFTSARKHGGSTGSTAPAAPGGRQKTGSGGAKTRGAGGAPSRRARGAWALSRPQTASLAHRASARRRDHVEHLDSDSRDSPRIGNPIHCLRIAVKASNVPRERIGPAAAIGGQR